MGLRQNDGFDGAPGKTNTEILAAPE